MTAPTETERRLKASISLATIRARLRTLANDMESSVALFPVNRERMDRLIDRVRLIEQDVARFGEQARALADGRAK